MAEAVSESLIFGLFDDKLIKAFKLLFKEIHAEVV
jgi:hypothetical protein